MLKQRKAVWAGWSFTDTGYPPIRWQGCSPVPSWIPLGFPGGSVVKESPANEETWVRSLGWEGPLEEGLATHSSILAWRIPQTEESGGLQSMGLQRVRHDRSLNNNAVIFNWRRSPSLPGPLLVNSLPLQLGAGRGECCQLPVDRRQRSYETSYDPHDSPHPGKELLAAESELCWGWEMLMWRTEIRVPEWLILPKTNP